MFLRSITAVAGLLAVTVLTLGASGKGYRNDPFPKCTPQPKPNSVSLVLKGPCRIKPNKTYKYTLLMTNGTKRKLNWARMVFARKSYIVRSNPAFKDQNVENPDSRVEWDYRNLLPGSKRVVRLWLRFNRAPSQVLTSYIVWLQAKPAGLRSIYHTWYPTLYFK